MIINTMAYLLLISLAGMVKLRMRYDRVVSWLMFFAVAFFFVVYNGQGMEGKPQGFSLLWSTSQIGRITIDFNPSKEADSLIVPIFFLSFLTIFNNNIFRSEEKRSIFDSLILLNFIVLSLLICSENYVQLITMVFVSDILGYLVLKDVDSSRRYVIYNFFADMCLFMMFALACGRIQSVELGKLWSYDEIGRHKDFVSIVAMLALFIKMGCLPFQGYLLDISFSRFQRMSAVNLLFSPLAGVLLLLKLHNLLVISDLFYPCYVVIAVMTFCAGIFGFLTKKHFLKKMVCLNMGFVGSLMFIFYKTDFVWQTWIACYYIVVYMFNQLFFKIYLYQNRETDITRMINGEETNAIALKTLLLQIAFLSGLFLMINLTFSQKLSSFWIFAEALLLTIAVSFVINHIYKSQFSRRLDYLIPNRLRFLSFIVNTCIILCGIYIFREHIAELVFFISLFLIFAASSLGKYFRVFYEKSWLQEKELSKSIFLHIIVYPFKYISRTLWLMVDLFLSEKIITSAISWINNAGVTIFFKLNKRGISACLIFILLGLLIFVVSFYGRS